MHWIEHEQVDKVWLWCVPKWLNELLLAINRSKHNEQYPNVCKHDNQFLDVVQVFDMSKLMSNDCNYLFFIVFEFLYKSILNGNHSSRASPHYICISFSSFLTHLLFNDIEVFFACYLEEILDFINQLDPIDEFVPLKWFKLSSHRLNAYWIEQEVDDDVECDYWEEYGHFEFVVKSSHDCQQDSK